MSVKYGPVLTYKDIEEAKKLIGKRIIASDSLQDIEDPDVLSTVTCTLCKVEEFKMFSHRYHTSSGLLPYQFIREVIEEPQYRPYTSEELAEQVGKVVRYKNTDTRVMATVFEDGKLRIARVTHAYTGEEFLEHFEFIDGSPCGVEVEE